MTKWELMYHLEHGDLLSSSGYLLGSCEASQKKMRSFELLPVSPYRLLHSSSHSPVTKTPKYNKICPLLEWFYGTEDYVVYSHRS